MHNKAMASNYLVVRTLLILITSLLVATGLHADTISLDSVGTAADSGQTNSNGATIAIAPNASWATALAGSSWVSYGMTGATTAPGFFVVPNGTVVTFSDVFNLSGIGTGGTINVMGDDSVAVFLNGTLLEAEGTSVGNTYSTCSDFGIGCLLATSINLPASDLVSGSNTLQFLVAQRAGSSFGLDYSGFVTDIIATPEASTLLLLGSGLLMLAGFAYRRRSYQSQLA